MAVPPNAHHAEQRERSRRRCCRWSRSTQADIDRIVAAVPGGAAQRPGHLSAGAAAGGHPVPSPAGRARAIRTSSDRPDGFPDPRAAGSLSRGAAGGDAIGTTSCARRSCGRGCGSRCRWCGARRRCRSRRWSWSRRKATPREQLARRFDPRHYRLDLTQAPLLRLVHRARAGQRSAGWCCCSSIT